jgi:hypothetical protein
MQKITSLLLIAGLSTACGVAFGQQQAGSRRATAKSSSDNDFVTRMMKFDKNKDGKLTRSEVSDTRMKRLFDRADVDKDGVVTKDELTALAASEPTNQRGGPGGFGPPGGPGGFGPGGPPRMGQVLPGFIQERLNLTAAQTKQVAELQKEVDAKLAKILSAEQNDQLKEMQERGPGGGPPGFGGPGGPPGGPGGPPPGGPGGPPPGGGGFPPPPPDEAN